MKKYVFTALMILGASSVLANPDVGEENCDFPSYIKKSLKGKVSAYCVDGKKLPLFTVGGNVISGHKAKIYINNKLIFNIEAKRWSGFSATINQYLNFNKNNSVKVEYEKVKSQDASFVRKIFKIDIEKQDDWKEQKSAKVLKVLEGPNNNLQSIGKTGVMEIKFIPKI